MTGRLLVNSGDFGWGAAGKLKLILDHLPGVRAIGVGSDLGRPLLSSVEYAADARTDRKALWRAVREHDVRLALVVGSNDVAWDLTALDVPVVFVDSLPYLWTEHDNVPTDVAVYCAQRAIALPPTAQAVMARVRNLRWVDAIVPPRRRRIGGGGALVNVGGLRSATSGDAADCYVRGVLPPVLAGLASAGLPVSAVCGALDEEQRAFIGALAGPRAQVGPVPPGEFDRLMRVADLLVTSPGSTTLLQAHNAGQRTLLLPPQNVSQVLNSEWFADADGAVIGWPTGVFDRARLDDLRPLGELAAVAYMYSVVCAARADASVHAELRGQVAEQAPRALRESADRAHLDALGNQGAHQVAQITRQLLLAPMSPPPGRGARSRAQPHDQGM